MITDQQSLQLATEAALNYRVKQGSRWAETVTEVEYLMAVAYEGEKAAELIVRHDTARADALLAKVAGLTLLALQNHGDRLYETYRLRRALHPDQEQVKAECLSHSFMKKEALDAFKALNPRHDESSVTVVTSEEAWKKLETLLLRLLS